MQKLTLLIALVLGVARSSAATPMLVAPLHPDAVPLGEFEATDEKENYANYISSLIFEFKDSASQGLLADKGNVKHIFSKTVGDQSHSFVHEFAINGTAYRFKLPFELGSEIFSSFNGTSFKYKYWFEQGQGMHADYNIPPENPMQIQHLYAPDQDGFVLVYKIGDVTARRRYERISTATTDSSQPKSTTANPKKP